MRMIALVSFAALGSNGVALAADDDSVHSSPALVRIERAFLDGEIDAPTRAIYGLLLLRAPDRLPAAFQRAPGERIRCGTLLMKRAFEERESYSAEQQILFAQFGGRPTGEAGAIQATTNEVLVHYWGANSAGAQNVADYADQSWDTEVDAMGWPAPLLDDGASNPNPPDPSTELDIYLDPSMTGQGAYCAPAVARTGNTWATYIAIDPTIPSNVMNTYVAHEFNHSLQFAIDDTEADWLFEATATFVEDKVYDAVDDYLYFVTDFQNAPTETLSFATYSSTYMYGGSVFLHYLAERFDNDGTTVVRDLWTSSTGTDFFDALENTILPGIGGAPADMMGLYADFAGYRWLSGNNSDGTWSDESAQWNAVPAARTYTTLADATVSGIDVATDPRKLGTSYIEVRTPDGVNGDRLTMTMTGDTAVTWAVTIIGQKATGAADITIVRDTDNDGEIVAASDSASQYEKVVFAVSNLGVTGQNPDRDTGGGGHTADLTRSAFTFDLFYSATGGDPVPEEPVACECNATRTTPGAGFLLLGLLGFAVVLVQRSR